MSSLLIWQKILYNMYNLFRMMHDNILREQEEMRMRKKDIPRFFNE